MVWFLKSLLPVMFLSFADEGGGSPTFVVNDEDESKKGDDTSDEEEFIKALDLPLDKRVSSSTKQEEKKDEKSEEETEKKEQEEQKQEEENKGEEEQKTGEEEETEDKKGEGEEEDKEEIDLNQDLDDATIQKLTPREKAFYYEMKKERKKRQEIEAEKDYLATQLKYNKPPEKKEESTKGEEEIDLGDLLKDKEDDDFIAVGEVKKLIPTLIKKEVSKTIEEIEKKKSEEQKRIIQQQSDQERRITELEEEFKKTHDDYEDMLNIAAKAMKDFPSLSLEVFNATQDPKGNPVEVVYSIGKKFQKIYGAETAETKKSQGAKDTQSTNTAKKIIENAERRKTSASVSGGGSKTFTLSDLESMDREELGQFLAKLPMSEYRKVPKHIRERAL